MDVKKMVMKVRMLSVTAKARSMNATVMTICRF